MNKRVFGSLELIFDALYLALALVVGIYLLSRAAGTAQKLAGAMALTLALGDAFHLVPRMLAAATGAQARFERAMGVGKFVTSIGMTAFYLMLLEVGVRLLVPAASAALAPTAPIVGAAYALAAVRVALCLFPQNRWLDAEPPLRWGVWRNIPFLLLGALVAAFYFVYAAAVPPLGWMWLAIVLSFAFYLPVVLWVHKNRRLGMLMLPKTCAYMWMLFMCVRAFS